MVARQKIEEWRIARDNEASGNRENNKQEAELWKRGEEAARSSNNPWIRVVDNCEMNPTHYVGGRDVTRMRQAMISRKADLTKSGGLKKAL